jgi:hypothetical protein
MTMALQMLAISDENLERNVAIKSSVFQNWNPRRLIDLRRITLARGVSLLV